MATLDDFINSLPEDKRETVAYNIANMDPKQKEDFLKKYNEIINENAAVQNTTQDSVVKLSTRSKNNPMSNKVVGIIGDKPVYQNSKGQYYYFTGKGGAAIVSPSQFTPVTEEVNAITSKENSNMGTGKGELPGLGLGLPGLGLGYGIYKARRRKEKIKELNSDLSQLKQIVKRNLGYIQSKTPVVSGKKLLKKEVVRYNDLLKQIEGINPKFFSNLKIIKKNINEITPLVKRNIRFVRKLY